MQYDGGADLRDAKLLQVWIMYRELEIAMNELGLSLGAVLAVAREISPRDEPLRTIDLLTARERVELVSVLRSACKAMAA